MSADGPAIDTTELETLRRHGFGVAYRMLGSVSEAEDVTQEALLRLTRQAGPIDEPAAWMTTVVTRLSINVLKSARARRESYVGPWLPEPLVEDPAPGLPATPCSNGSSRPPRTATWTPWRSCSPGTPSSTRTAAARCWRRRNRSSAPR